MKLDDQFEWDIDNEDASPEQFAEVYGNDLGLTGEFKTAIAHAIREQVHSYQKSLFIVGRPSDGSAIQDEDLRMSFLPYVSSGPRPVDQTQAFTPILNYLSDGEIERIDKEREKELNKRRKRNTRGRRGIALPDREPIKTHRTPAIGFPEVDPNTLALAAALAPPPTRRGAAIAASVTIANMVASENGTTILPQSQPVQPQPVPQIVSRLAKPKGSFKAPAYAPDVLKRRAKVSAPTPSTAADASTFGPPLEGDNPLPPSSSAAAPPDSRSSKIITARRQRELEKEAKEKEFADGQHANMIDGVWHCSNCGCPDPIAIGRRKGPLGDKSQCGACGKFWHRHRRPRPVDYHADAEYHINLKLESERARTPARKRGAAALKAQNQAQQEQTPPPSVSEHDASLSKHELWGEKSIRKGKQAQTSGSGPLDRPLSPASSVSSSASERPLAETVLQTNGPPPPPESSTKDLTASAANGDATSSSVKSTSERPEWLDNALAEVLVKYPDDKLDIIPRRGAGPVEWRIKCLDCPGKLYTPGPGETLNNFEVHLKNRQHRHKVSARVEAA
ncbi:SNF5-domain-containing protein, partial [Rickenella mellea]